MGSVEEREGKLGPGVRGGPPGASECVIAACVCCICPNLFRACSVMGAPGKGLPSSHSDMSEQK